MNSMCHNLQTYLIISLNMDQFQEEDKLKDLQSKCQNVSNRESIKLPVCKISGKLKIIFV